LPFALEARVRALARERAWHQPIAERGGRQAHAAIFVAGRLAILCAFQRRLHTDQNSRFTVTQISPHTFEKTKKG
jgi:hypothetical protein